MLASIGVAGIAIGFTAQDSPANVMAGFLIFIDKPFQVGDWVAVADNYGAVTDITMRSTENPHESCHASIERNTKDLNTFVRREDVQRTLDMFRAAA